MADYVTGVKTSEGVKKIDYNALANKPGIVTAEEDGLMSAGDKVKFDEICEDVKELQDITSQAGTDIEDIKQDMSAVQQAVENAQSTADEALELANTMHGIVTSGDGSAYIAEVGGISALDVGVSFMMIPHTTSTSTSPTLNVNGLGPVNIRRQVSTGTLFTAVGASENWLEENKPICVTYDGEYWVADIVKPDLNDVEGVIPVEKGGTGANNVINAVKNLSVPTLLQGENIPNGSNLDDYYNIGTYHGNHYNSIISNCPARGPFKLHIYYSDDPYQETRTVVQEITDLVDGTYMLRSCLTTNGEWGGWTTPAPSMGDILNSLQIYLRGNSIVTGTAEIAYGPQESRVTVIFGSKFKSAPVVLVSQVFDSANIIVTNKNIDTDKFQAVVQGGFEKTGTREFSWVAIGQPPD